MDKTNQTRQIRTKPHPNCILCGGPGEKLYDNLTDGLYGAPGIWTLKRCRHSTCGIIWLDPTPVEEDLHIPYETYFTHDEVPGGNTALLKFRAVLYRIYKALKIVPSWIVGLAQAQKQMRYMFLDDLPKGRVLDIGCGDGAFLSLMQQSGWSVDGVDFDAKAIESAKTKFGLTLRQGDLFSARFDANSFDAATLSHVIEHVPDPVALLREIGRILKPGGRLVVTTPNSKSLGHDWFQRYWIGLDPPRHLNVFTLSALRECASRAGLKVVETKSTAANADIVLGGSYSIRHFQQQQDRSAPRPQINIARSIRCAWLQYREYFSLRRNPECGEEAVLICAKKSV